MENDKPICQHKYFRLGFCVIETEAPNLIKAVVALFCQKCGSFKTKILTYDKNHETLL